MELIIAIMMYMGILMAPGQNVTAVEGLDNAAVQVEDNASGGMDFGGRIIIPDPQEL